MQHVEKFLQNFEHETLDFLRSKFKHICLANGV